MTALHLQKQIIKTNCTLNDLNIISSQATLTNLFRKFLVVLNIMHGLWVVNFRNCVAPKYHGFWISAQSYDFCPRLAQLDNLDFTVSPVHFICFLGFIKSCFVITQKLLTGTFGRFHRVLSDQIINSIQCNALQYNANQCITWLCIVTYILRTFRDCHQWKDIKFNNINFKSKKY